MPPLSQSFSFLSDLSRSQYAQNSKGNKSESLRRVTITQLMKATHTGVIHSPFMIDNVAVERVALVANVLEEDVIPGSKTTYRLDDGTGKIKGHRWLSDGESMDFQISLHPFAYARVTAELTVYKSYRILKILQIAPIGNVYEVYDHILGVIFDTIALEKGSPPPHILRSIDNKVDDIGTFSQQFTQDMSISLSTQIASSSSLEISASVVSSIPSQVQSLDNNSPTIRTSPLSNLNLTPLERDIIYCMSDKTTDDSERIGVHVTEFIPDIIALNPDLTSRNLWDAMEGLRERGILEVTVSEEYYRCRLD